MTKTSLTNVYTKVADIGAWNVIQNIGNKQIEVYISDTETDPTGENDDGFIFRVLDAFTPDMWGDGYVYARVKGDSNDSGSVMTN